MNTFRKQSFHNSHENKENMMYNTDFKPREHHLKSNNIIIGHGSNFGKEPIRPPPISQQYSLPKQTPQPPQIQKQIVNQPPPQQNLTFNPQFQNQNYNYQLNQNQGQNQNYLSNMDYQLQIQNQQLQLLLQQQLQLQKEQLQNQQMNYMKQINTSPSLAVNPTLPIPFASLPLPIPLTLPLPLLPLPPFQNNELFNLTNQLINSTPLNTSPSIHDIQNPIFPQSNEITSTIGTKSDSIVKPILSPTSSSSSSTSCTSSFNRIVGHQLKNQKKRNIQEMDRIRSRYIIQNGVKVRIRNQDLDFPTTNENKNSAKLLKTSPHYHFWSNRANLHVGVLTWDTINSIPFNLSNQI